MLKIQKINKPSPRAQDRNDNPWLRNIKINDLNKCCHTLTRFTRLVILEPLKGPKIGTITSTATSLQVNWSMLDPNDANGKITKYEVFYEEGSEVSNMSRNETVIGGNILMKDLTGLRPATKYTVAVRAFTEVGAGPLGEAKSANTNESGEFICSVYFFLALLNLFFYAFLGLDLCVGGKNVTCLLRFKKKQLSSLSSVFSHFCWLVDITSAKQPLITINSRED